MDNTTNHEEDHRSTDPARFADMLRSAPQEKRRVGELIGSALALFALVIGLPAALLVLSGPPRLPESAPSLRDLAQQLSFEDLLSVLVAIVWLVWAYFIVCVFVEVIAARRGGMAKSVPLAGPLQKLAQVLVGALLLSGLLASTAQASVADAGRVATPVTATATWGASAAVDAADQVVTDVAAAADASAAQGDNLIGQKVYTVTAPKNGYHDNLWDIAERHLGEGQRYKEIYELNKDRIQPDGRKLELARLIQPGWDLAMPDDATGIARVQAPDPVLAPVPAPVASAETGSTGEMPAAAEARAIESDAGGALAGAGLLAAGVIAALVLQRRRRLGGRPEDEALEAEAEFRFAASQARCAWLDVALRQLGVSCRGEGLALPPVYAAVVDDSAVELLLAPAVPTAPEGWTPLEDGRRWRRVRDGAEPELPRKEVAPYPALVSVGLDEEGRDVLVDLEAAGGVIAIGGDPTIAQEFAAALAVQSATAPWSEVVRVVATQLPDGMSEIGDERIRIVDDLQDVLTGFEEKISHLRDDVLTGRTKRRGIVDSHLIVAGAMPDQAIADRLTALTGPGRQALSVVVAGEHKSARWRFSVDDNGTLSIPVLGINVVANRLSGRHVDALVELFSVTRQEEEPERSGRVDIAQPLRRVDDAMWTTAARRVGVLGQITVQGAGDLPADRADLATELVSYLALHPEGVHPQVLAGVLWPRGVSDDVATMTIERARKWLGIDVDGSHFLRESSDGRLSVSDRVVCDWDCVRNLLIASRKAANSNEEAELLRRALQLVRGEVFDGIPQRRYGWIAHDDLTRTMVRVVTDGAHRLAQLLNGDDDTDGAAKAAESGLRINPGSQVLWRELMRARYGGTGIAGGQQTLDTMGEALQGIPLEAETEALVEEYLPATGANAAV